MAPEEHPAPLPDVLLIGGRSGVGKSSVTFEVSDQLQAAGVAHCIIDGDALDAAYPKPVDDPHGTRLTETNLRALWQTFREAGHHRLVYVNTVSVLEADLVVRAVGGTARTTGVLLTGTDATARERLARREVGGGLQRQVGRSDAAAGQLEESAGDWVHRVATDGRTVPDIAHEVVAMTGWYD